MPVPDKPRHRSSYTVEETEQVKAVCLTVAVTLGAYLDDVCIVGGLVPPLLIDTTRTDDDDDDLHPGTTDLDVGLALALLDEERYAEISRRLRSEGFKPDTNKNGNQTVQRWRLGELKVTVDFLMPPAPAQEPAVRVQNLEPDFGALITPGLELAFDEHVKYEWSFGDGSLPDTTGGAEPSHYYLQPGTYQVSLTVNDGAGSADASTQTLPITITGAGVGAPSAAILSPSENQTYTVGESVATSFSCTDAASGPGIVSCTDSDDSASPGTLDTATVGAHSYTVTAVSLDGERGTATIEYTVANPGTGTGTGTGGNGPGGGSGNPGNSTPSSSGSGAGASSASTSGGGSGAATTSTTTRGAKPTATPTTAQKLAQAIKACKKLKKSKRARCVAAAKRRFAPAKRKHTKAKPRAGHDRWSSGSRHSSVVHPSASSEPRRTSGCEPPATLRA